MSDVVQSRPTLLRKGPKPQQLSAIRRSRQSNRSRQSKRSRERKKGRGRTKPTHVQLHVVGGVYSVMLHRLFICVARTAARAQFRRRWLLRILCRLRGEKLHFGRGQLSRRYNRQILRRTDDEWWQRVMMLPVKGEKIDMVCKGVHSLFSFDTA